MPFRYTILDAGNTRKAKDIIDAVMHADEGFYLLCSRGDGAGNYFAHAWGRTPLETLEHFHGKHLPLDNLHDFEKENCFISLYLLPTTPAYFEVVCSEVVLHSLTQGSPCHTEKGMAVAGHRKPQIPHFFKGLRQILRLFCNEELDALKKRVHVSSDLELARCLKINIRQIRDLRRRGSLCQLDSICQEAGIPLGIQEK